MDGGGAGGIFLSHLNKVLEPGWQAKLNKDGRLYYLNHNNETSHWLPPRSNWPQIGELPYGWENARDKNGKDYYINHRTCVTTREDPFDLEEAPPEERDVVLVRDVALGFGFIAGSEKPVVIRSVTEGGPSVGKLLPGDEILRLNGENVKNSDRQYIIDKIRYSTDEIALTVIQPYIDKTGLKSSFLSATKKQKLRAKPPHVRFAENVNTFPSNLPKIPPSLVYLPNVLKVYLENGQTKSFRYDDNTRVKDVLENLQEKLAIKCLEYFSLVVEDVREPSQQRSIVLQEHEALCQIADRPGSQNWKCVLRVSYVPVDAYDLLSEDPKAFDYFYQQCCNDVLQGKFSSELKMDVAVRLASLHIHQHVQASKKTAKVSVKSIEKEDGLGQFLPDNVLSHWKSKELRKMISQCMKQNQSLTPPGQKSLTELQAKLHYLKIIGGLKTIGAKMFETTILDFPDLNQQSDATVIVGPRCGISLVAKTGDQVPILELGQLARILLTVESGAEEGLHRLELHQKSGQPVVLLMASEEAHQMAFFVNGYYRLLVNRNRALLTEKSIWIPTGKKEAPPYLGRHRVQTAKWSYPDDLASEVIQEETNNLELSETKPHQEQGMVTEGERWIDLSGGPPPYEADNVFLNRMMMENRMPNGLDMISEASDRRTDVLLKLPENDPIESEKVQLRYEEEDLSHSSDDSQLSEEKGDMEKEKTPSPVLEEITKLLSSGASSPGSDINISNESDTTLMEGDKKKRSKSGDGAPGNKREKSLTEGISKKLFRSLTGMKFNVKDTVATNDSCNVSATDLKLLHVTPSPEDESPSGERPITDCAKNAMEGDSRDAEVNEERPNSRLMARDSILIQHRKASPRFKRRLDSDESDDISLDANGHSKSFDSDVIDLTSVDDFEVDSDLSPSRSLSNSGAVADYDDVFLDNESDISKEGSKEEAKFEAIDVDDVVLDTTLSTSTSTEGALDSDSNQSCRCDFDEEAELSGTDGDDLVRDPSSHSNSNSLEESGTDDDHDDHPLIDNPSSEQAIRSPMDTSDEAHGMQLAALVALNASLEIGKEPQEAASKGPDAECESDSGNETISSEIDTSNIDQAGLSQSPRDYLKFFMTSDASSSINNHIECAGSSTTLVRDEEVYEPYSSIAGFGTSSDTESTSTLHGSSPNLSSIDVGEDTAPVDLPEDMSPIDLSSLEPVDVQREVNDIEALIANLVVPLPPLLDTEEIDEELLQAIIPPPPLEGFDEGTIQAVLLQSAPHEFDGDTQSDRNGADAGTISCEVGEDCLCPSHILDSVNLPPALPQPHVGRDENGAESRDEEEEELPVCFYGMTQPPNDDTEGDDESDKDLDEEAGLRELLELTLTDQPGKALCTADESERNEDEEECLSSPVDIPQILEQEESSNYRMTNLNDSNDIMPAPDICEAKDDVGKGNDDLLMHYDSYGQLRGQHSSEQKVANILDAIIMGSTSNGVSSPPSSISTPTSNNPLHLSHEVHPKPRSIQQSRLQGSVDSGFHQPDADQLSLTSPSDTNSLCSIDNGCCKGDPKRENIDMVPKALDVEAGVVKNKYSGPKPNVPPKPPRPKDLKLKLRSLENDESTESGIRKKYPAPQPPQPPQPPPRKRYKAPGIAAKASRFESQERRADSLVDRAEGFGILPKSFAPPIPNYDDVTTTAESERKPDLSRVQSVDGMKSVTVEINGSPRNSDGKQVRSKPVTRSHTFSETSPSRESSKLYPMRKAPPPPHPKPKITSVPSSPVVRKASEVKESLSASNSPRGSINKKQSFSGSLSRLLSPHKSKTWGQFKDSLPFKQGSLKGGVGSVRSKSKSRKPLKALWPSATCDGPGENDDKNSSDGKESRTIAYGFQRSESLEFESKSDIVVERRARSYSLNMMRSASQDSATDSDFDTPKGSPNLSQSGTLMGRQSAMIHPMDNYPPALVHPKRPPPPRPSNPPVMQSASVGKLCTEEFKSSPVKSIHSPASPKPLPSPIGSYDGDAGARSPSPPPLPTSKPPDFSVQDLDGMPVTCHEDDSAMGDTSGADLIKIIESREYFGVTAISNAIRDIDMLAHNMNSGMVHLLNQSDARQFRQAKDTLLTEVREFTSNTKMVVSAAGQAGEQLRESTNSSMHTLARLCSATQATTEVMFSTNQAQNLGTKVEAVARNFSATLQAANEAHGRPLCDPKMQQLLRRAQTMAALLSALMRSLRMLQQ